MSSLFLPSMIEVEFSSYYKRCANVLFNAGFNSFHIDFGDDKLIGRELECWDKVEFLRSLGPEMKLTAHLMCKSGSHNLSVETITEKCLEEGFEIIYIHSRSFESFDKLLKFKDKFFSKAHHIFGLVSELEDKKNQNLIEFAFEHSVKNLLQMGVPIGKGGQKFGWLALERIKDFDLSCPSLSNIELDGGLTFDVLKDMKKCSANRFAGWSIISDQDPLIVLSKAHKINNII